MARTQITNIGANILSSAGAVSPALNVSFTAADSSNGNYFTASGRDLLMVHNTDASPHTLTLLSAADQYGRKADIVGYSVPAGGYLDVVITAASIFTQADGTVLLTASDPTVKLLVLSL